MEQLRIREELKIRAVNPAEAPRAVSVQMMAFRSDPIMRWLWPEPHEYVRHFPALVRGFGGWAFENGTAHVTDTFLGGTLWLPPGITNRGRMREAAESLARARHMDATDDPLTQVLNAAMTIDLARRAARSRVRPSWQHA